MTGNQNSAEMKVIQGGSRRATVNSIRSRSSAARLRELEAREMLACLELQRIEAASNLARIRLEKHRIEVKVDDLDNEREERTSHVQNCIQTSPSEDMKDTLPEPELEENQVILKNEQPLTTAIEVQSLAGVVRKAFDTVVQPSLSLDLHSNNDLPCHDGTKSEWVASRFVYNDTSKSLTATQNMARLRTSIEVAARNTIKSLLYFDVTRDQVMKALQHGYRRADPLKMQELDLKVKKTTYWPDFSIVLLWIKSNPRNFKIFAEHRIVEIGNVTQLHELVSTTYNTANGGTCNVLENFSKSRGWFTDLDFLKKEEKCWTEKRAFQKWKYRRR